MNSFNTQDQRKAESIRRQYISRQESEIEQLKKLDGKVKAPGKAVAYILGVAGALIMGSGMSFVMVWSSMGTGLALGIPGMIMALCAYPLYALITNRRKKKYTQEILTLTNALINPKGE